MLVADTDILSDRLWVQIQQFLGQRVMNAFSNNGDFAVNAVDNLSGSSDLISIRWAHGAMGVVNNLTKNFFAVLSFQWWRAVASAIAVAFLNVGPFRGVWLAHGRARAPYAGGRAARVGTDGGGRGRCGSRWCDAGVDRAGDSMAWIGFEEQDEGRTIRGAPGRPAVGLNKSTARTPAGPTARTATARPGAA